MNKKLTDAQIFQLACEFGYEYRMLKAIIKVESGGVGFSDTTGKIIIQFEPHWFKRHKKDWANATKHLTWQSNKVGNQTEEWKAFNDAFAVDANAAMKSTSIGLMQLMGFHYIMAGFKTVGEMWDAAKESEYNQVRMTLVWISKNPSLVNAIKKRDFRKIAYYYNGSEYEKYNYHNRLSTAYSTSKEYVPN